MESSPQDLDIVNKIFGYVHTLKGASGFFEPKTLHLFVHKFEDLINKLRNGQLYVNPEVVSILLKGLDILNKLVAELKNGVHKLKNLDELLALIQIAEGTKTPTEKNTVKPDEIKSPAPEVSQPEEEDLKVPIHVLDEFVQKSGDLTVLRYMANELYKGLERKYRDDKNFIALGQLLEEMHKINVSVQSKTLELRKVSLKQIVRPYTRIIRDLSKSLKKKVLFTVSGDELRLDISIGKVLSRALIHLIRNSLDHGLELPDRRKELSKSEQGNVSISASSTSDFITVQITDDGAGIDPSRIKAKLLKDGNIPKEVVEKMSNQTLIEQIFEPGFSTAAQVTSVSGRGVGMDMVKTSVEAVGGTVNVKTELGKGSIFTLIIPVPKSTAIISALFIEVQNQIIGIPQENIIKVFETKEGVINEITETLEGTTTLRFQDQLLPVISLNRTLNLLEKSDSDYSLIVVKAQNGATATLKVQKILDLVDSVVKEPPNLVKNLGIYSGATFRGDGSVSLLLNIDGILNRAGFKRPTKVKPANADQSQLGENRLVQIENPNVLFFDLTNVPSTFAVFQKDILRVDHLKTAHITVSGSKMVMPYRDRIMELIDLKSKLGYQAEANTILNSELVSALVVQKGKEYKAIIINSVKESGVLTEQIDDSLQASRAIKGSFAHGGKTITLVDVETILNSKAS